MAVCTRSRARVRVRVCACLSSYVDAFGIVLGWRTGETPDEIEREVIWTFNLIFWGIL